MADVMQEVKKQNVADDIPMLDILRQDVGRSGGDFNSIYRGLKTGIESGKMRIMRSGNTLLIYNILQPGIVELHISTVDEPTKLVKSIKELYQAMKVAGFKTGVSTTDNSQIARVLNAADIPVRVEQIPSAEGRTEYQLTIEVK
jgi:hypothetical protein